jgi:hypothetical protein
MPASEISFYSAYQILLLCWQSKKCLGSVSTSALATACGTPGTLNAKHSQLLESPYTSHNTLFPEILPDVSDEL